MEIEITCPNCGETWSPDVDADKEWGDGYAEGLRDAREIALQVVSIPDPHPDIDCLTKRQTIQALKWAGSELAKRLDQKIKECK